MSDTPIVKSKEAARQGKSGVGVRYVLIASLALVVIAFALVALIGH